MPRAPLFALSLLATPLAGQDHRPAPPSATALRLLAGLRWPLPARLDRIPLLCPDDVAADLPFTVRLGARLYRTDLEDVEEHAPGTEVFAPWPDAAASAEAGSVVQRLDLGAALRLTVSGIEATASEPAAGQAIGRLGTALPLPACDGRLADLGYLPGPHLLLRIDGLFPDSPAGHDAFRRFAREHLLPALTNAPSARPTARPPRWAAPSERTLDGYARALVRGSAAHATAPAVQPEPAPNPRLGFFQVTAGREVRVAEAGPVFERLVARFLAGLRWPYPDLPGLTRFWGEDDQYGRMGAFPHRALDLGARLRDAEGQFHLWPAHAPLYRLHEALPGPSGELLLQDGDHVLRVELQTFHLEARSHADGAIGALEPFEERNPLGGWRTSDPFLRLLGVPKGNHLHVLVRGVFTEDEERRAAFLRERVLPAWLLAPAAAVTPRVLPIPAPAAGDGDDEDRDPRGAAILRAQLRLLTRRLQPLGAQARSVTLVPATMDPTDPEIRVVIGTAAGALLAPPARDARLAPDGPDLVQELTATAAGRNLPVTLRMRGAAATPAGLRSTGVEVELRIATRFPHARAWVLAHVLPALRGG